MMTRSSKRQTWNRPDPAWVPLGKAVLQFATEDDRGSAASMKSKSPLPGMTKQYPDFKEVTKSFSKLVDNTIVEIDNLKLQSLTELQELLANQTSATDVKTDLKRGCFVFQFRTNSGSTMLCNLSPWEDYAEYAEAPPDSYARINAVSLFNKSGFVTSFNDEKIAEDKKISELTGKATSLVWNQYLLPVFDRLIVAGNLNLYARPFAVSAPFERLPSDTWPSLHIVDWPNGVLRAIDGSHFWSAYVSDMPVEPRQSDVQSSQSRAPARARAKEAIKSLYPAGVPTVAKLSNAALCRNIAKHLKQNSSQDVSNDTMLRAANRRK